MPEYLSPGVYVEEINSGPRPIEGVGTAMAAFVGFAPSGPANTPMLITSWQQYVETFGALEEGGVRNPHMPGTYLSHSIYGYFNNGGTRCYVTRVVPTGGKDEKPVSLQLPSRASKAVPSLTIAAKGAPSSDIQVEVTKPPAEDSDEGSFNLRVKIGTTEEVFENVIVGKPGKGAKSKALAEAVAQSQIITITEEKGAQAPELGSFVIKAAQGSAMPMVQSTHFVGDVSTRTGLEGLEIAEDVTMLLAPDLMSAFEQGMIDKDGVKAVQIAMMNHCERVKGRMAIIDPLPNMSPQEVKKWREKEANFDSNAAALYYPWIKVNGPDGKPLAVPPSGHVAGIWARNDAERGVHKAPANEVVRGALDPVTQVTKGEQDTLNPSGINCIRTFTGMGIRVWGARTLSSDPAWRYVPVRRLFNYVEKSIERGTQWVVFEPNDQNLWERVKRDVNAFLTVVWREGALFGANPAQAFFVKCDASNNPPETRDMGRLYVEIGIAPVKPAEFVILQFSQYAGGGS
jgi:phage tail sheath protein FI